MKLTKRQLEKLQSILMIERRSGRPFIRDARIRNALIRRGLISIAWEDGRFASRLTDKGRQVCEELGL